MKNATVRARIEPRLKTDVDRLFERLGLSTTEAITLFYRQVRLRKGLPFRVEIPNAETLQVFKDTDAGKNLNRYGSVEKMFESLEND